MKKLSILLAMIAMNALIATTHPKGILKIINKSQCQLTPPSLPSFKLLSLSQKNSLEFDISFSGVNSNRTYSLPVEIKCNNSQHTEIISISAQTTSMDFSIQSYQPYAETHLVISGEHRIDEHNETIVVIAIPYGFDIKS